MLKDSNIANIINKIESFSYKENYDKFLLPKASSKFYRFTPKDVNKIEFIKYTIKAEAKFKYIGNWKPIIIYSLIPIGKYTNLIINAS